MCGHRQEASRDNGPSGSRVRRRPHRIGCGGRPVGPGRCERVEAVQGDVRERSGRSHLLGLSLEGQESRDRVLTKRRWEPLRERLVVCSASASEVPTLPEIDAYAARGGCPRAPRGSSVGSLEFGGLGVACEAFPEAQLCLGQVGPRRRLPLDTRGGMEVVLASGGLALGRLSCAGPLPGRDRAGPSGASSSSSKSTGVAKAKPKAAKAASKSCAPSAKAAGPKTRGK